MAVTNLRQKSRKQIFRKQNYPSYYVHNLRKQLLRGRYGITMTGKQKRVQDSSSWRSGGEPRKIIDLRP